jgi:hypothetical protein
LKAEIRDQTSETRRRAASAPILIFTGRVGFPPAPVVGLRANEYAAPERSWEDVVFGAGYNDAAPTALG